jgi:hypothetical protein
MRKMLLITAMFMAMNTWSADYFICVGTINDVEKCVKGYISFGYEPAGGVSQYENEYSQAVWLK